MSIVIVCIIFAVIFLSVLWFEPFKWQKKIAARMGRADYMRFIARHDPELMIELKKRKVVKDE